MNPREITALIRAMRIEQHNLTIAIDVLGRIAGTDVQEPSMESEPVPVVRPRIAVPSTADAADPLVRRRRKRSAESIRKQIATRAANAKKRTSRSRVNGSGKSATV